MCLFVSSLLSFPLFSTIYFLLRSRSFGLYRIVKKECQLDPILFRKFLALLCNDAGLYYTNFCNCLHLSLSLSFSLSLIISPSLSHSLILSVSFSLSLSLSLSLSHSIILFLSFSLSLSHYIILSLSLSFITSYSTASY